MSDNSESAKLAKAMREAGPSCCKSVTAVNDVLRQAGFDNTNTPAEQDVARVLGMVVTKPAKSAADNLWDFKHFATAVNKHSIDWNKVIEALDYPDFKVADPAGFEYIITSFRAGEKVSVYFHNVRSAYFLYLEMGHETNAYTTYVIRTANFSLWSCSGVSGIMWRARSRFCVNWSPHPQPFLSKS